MKKVSIHIVTFNSEAYIRDCLECVMKQTYPIEQIIIVDNNSQDGTLTILEDFKGNIMVVRNDENVGFASGHNQAIRMSSSDYFLVLNPDVKLCPDYILCLIRISEMDSKIGSLTGKLLLGQSPDQIDSTGLIITKSRRAFDRGASQSSEFVFEEEVFGVSGAAAFYNREMVKDISIDDCFFDEDFFAYKEDVDVAWRARLLGWKAYYSPEALAYHERGWKKESRSQIPLRIRRYSYINRYKIIVKNDHWLYVLKHIIPILSYEVPSFLYFLMKEPLVLGSWKDFWNKFGDLLRKRKMVQSKRRARFGQLYSFFR
ncbi:glycosyltransferase family 2 protein [Paenibacillus allorhizosphaerae]|uniref:glycosyltransferase family 2 protein n=2 Tax=Paenibacillus allorhizosphaerae TaxID=2849866 RepID=UPI00360F08E7